MPLALFSCFGRPNGPRKPFPEHAGESSTGSGSPAAVACSQHHCTAYGPGSSHVQMSMVSEGEDAPRLDQAREVAAPTGTQPISCAMPQPPPRLAAPTRLTGRVGHYGSWEERGQHLEAYHPQLNGDLRGACQHIMALSAECAMPKQGHSELSHGAMHSLYYKPISAACLPGGSYVALAGPLPGPSSAPTQHAPASHCGPSSHDLEGWLSEHVSEMWALDPEALTQNSAALSKVAEAEALVCSVVANSAAGMLGSGHWAHGAAATGAICFERPSYASKWSTGEEYVPAPDAPRPQRMLPALVRARQQRLCAQAEAQQARVAGVPTAPHATYLLADPGAGPVGAGPSKPVPSASPPSTATSPTAAGAKPARKSVGSRPLAAFVESSAAAQNRALSAAAAGGSPGSRTAHTAGAAALGLAVTARVDGPVAQDGLTAVAEHDDTKSGDRDETPVLLSMLASPRTPQGAGSRKLGVSSASVNALESPSGQPKTPAAESLQVRLAARLSLMQSVAGKECSMGKVSCLLESGEIEDLLCELSQLGDSSGIL